MENLFGIPVDTLMLILVVTVLVIAGAISGLIMRNRVFFVLGIRNIPRRWGRTALIVVGLMLGTAIISAALSTGDTMSYSVRSLVLKSLGNIDEVISVEGAVTDESVFEETTGDVAYFDLSLFDDVLAAIDGNPLVDGLAPAIFEDVAVQDVTSAQNEPRVTMFATDPAFFSGFGEISNIDGGTVSLSDLGPGEVYLNADAADELNASTGDELIVFAAGSAGEVRVRSIVEYDGTTSDAASMLMTLDAAQELLGRDGEIRYILVSNSGDAVSGEKHTDDVIAALTPILAPIGLESSPVKQDATMLADEIGSAFTSIFAIFGSFSIIAGIMLIFLIFVMLAAERKSEMGIARAVGMQRRHLVEMFLFEGAAYDLAAAAVGAVLGLAVALGMVLLMASAFTTTGIDITFDLRASSLVIGFTLGLVLTFVVVTISAWRISVLNIVSAIRNLPEPAGKRGRWIVVLWILLVALGVLMTVSGLSAKQSTPFMFGTSLIFIGVIPVLRRLRLGERISYTVPSFLMLVWWLLPFDALDFILPEMSSDMSIFILSGVMMVAAATWLVMYNSDILIRGMMALFGRAQGIAPGMRLAMSYALANRFRTGMALAMFTLVVFTLVVMASMTEAFGNAQDDMDAFGGGFDIRATTLTVNPVGDMAGAITEADAIAASQFDLVSDQSLQLIDALQLEVGVSDFETYVVHGLDEVFLDNTTYEFAIRAEGYESDAAVWQAIKTNPGLGVVDPFVVPRRDQMGFSVGIPDFRIEGFFLEDDSFTPVEVDVRDPQSGRSMTITLIGVLKDTLPPFMVGMSTSQASVEEIFPDRRAVPIVHLFDTAQGADAGQIADALERTFLANGLEAELMRDELDDLIALSRTFNYIMQGFMALGLVVGVAALGVISARSVVERRQEIGVMRAIGFQSRLVQFSFLVEASFVAILGIVLGLFLGLVLSYNIVTDAATTASWDNLTFAVPWLNLAIIFGVTYAAALLMTLVPARQASKVYPAIALRYE